MVDDAVPDARVPLPTDPPGSWAPAALVAAVGAAGPAWRVWDHGDAARANAVALTVVAGCLVACSTVVRRSWRSRLVVVAASAAIAALLTFPTLGRAPAAVVVAVTAAGDLAWRRPGLAVRPPALVASLLTVGASAAWAGGSNLGVVAVMVAAAVAVTVAMDRDTEATRRLDRASAAILAPPAAAVRAAGVALTATVRTASRAALATGTAARSGARTVARAVAGAARWVASPSNRPAVLAGAVAAAVTAPIFWRIAVDPDVLVRGTNDINSGVPRIRAITFWPLHITAAHPGWLLLMRAMFEVMSVAAATTLVSSVATGAAVVVATLSARSRFDARPALGWRGALLVGAGVVAFESPAVLVPKGEGVWSRFELAGTLGRGTGFLALHQWATPTIVMVLPMTLLTLALVARLVGDDEWAGRFDRRVARRSLAVLTVVGTLVQPGPVLALVPAAVVYVLLTGGERRRDALRAIAAPFVVPATLIVLGQVVFLRSDVSEYEQARWMWRPLWMWEHFGLDRIACWLVLAVFLIPLVGDRRRFLATPSVAIPLLGALIAVPPALFLEQSTVAAIPDADLAVPLLMSVMLLFVGTLRHVALAAQEWFAQRATAPPVWLGAVAAVLVAMLAAGVVDLAMAAGVLAEL